MVTTTSASPVVGVFFAHAARAVIVVTTRASATATRSIAVVASSPSNTATTRPVAVIVPS